MGAFGDIIVSADCVIAAMDGAYFVGVSQSSHRVGVEIENASDKSRGAIVIASSFEMIAFGEFVIGEQEEIEERISSSVVVIGVSDEGIGAVGHSKIISDRGQASRHIGEESAILSRQPPTRRQGSPYASI